MSKRKTAKIAEQEKKSNSALLQDNQGVVPDIGGEEQEAAGEQSMDRTILDLQQTYGNGYVRNLVESTRNRPDKSTSARIASQRGHGEPLDTPVRRKLGNSFNDDLGEVKVHTDGEAAVLAETLNAAAFTVGKDVFFAGNAYQPATEQGMKTLRHELAHVLQQVEEEGTGDFFLTKPDDAAEVEASYAESGGVLTAGAKLPAGAIARINPVATPEAPSASSTPTSTTPESAGGGDDAVRRAALVGMWNAMVVGPVTQAHQLVSSGPITQANANQAVNHVNTSLNGIGAVMESYVSRPEFYTALQRDYNALNGINIGLGQIAGMQLDPGVIVHGLEMESGRLAEMSGQL